MAADDPISGGAGWYAEAPAPFPDRPRLTFDLDVDVCVVGGGLAGLHVAREIARCGWSVAVLEAQTVGAGASGHNVGFVIPGFLETMDTIIERVGLDHARELWALSVRGVEYIRETIRETQMPGVTPVDGWLEVAKFGEDEDLTKQAALLTERFDADVETWSAAQVRGVLRSRLYHNAIHFPRAFHINPINYVKGLAAAAEQAGARIFEHTPALSLDPSGVRKRIGTPSARVRAARIVLAGNIGLDGLMPRVAATLQPVTSYVATTAPLGDRLKEAITYTGAVSDTDFIDNHYRIIGGDRLIWNGGMTVWQGDPKRFVRQLAGDIRRAFPQLGRVELDHVWSGTTGTPVHTMPQVGEVMPGVWLSGGYSGQGFNTSAAAAELIAKGIIEGDDRWRLFSAFDLVWAGGKFGRAALQVMYWTRRIRERLQTQLGGAADLEETAAVPAKAPHPAEPPAMVEPSIVPEPEPVAAEAAVPPMAGDGMTDPQAAPVAQEGGMPTSRKKRVRRRNRAAPAGKSKDGGKDGAASAGADNPPPDGAPAER